VLQNSTHFGHFKGRDIKFGTVSQYLQLLQLSQPPHGAPDGGSGGGGVVPSSSSYNDPAVLVTASPDTNDLPLHLVLATEGASVLRVLGDFHLLDGLPEAGAVPGAVLAGDSNLLGSLGHLE